MGLIVDENGHYRGWLASILCCCAALTEDEYPSERKKDNTKRKHGVLSSLLPLTHLTDNRIVTAKEIPYQQQPAPTALPVLPEPTYLSSKIVLDSDANSLHDSRHSESHDLSQPLNFDPDSVLPSPAAKNPTQDELELARSTTNDTIRTLRHVRPSPSGSIHRQALIPIQLGPVVLRDAAESMPDDMPPAPGYGDVKTKRQHQKSESTQDLLGNASRPSYFDNRETPYQRCGRQSSETLALRLQSQESVAPKSTASTQSLSSSYRQHARDSSNASSLLTLTERPRTGARLQRKRSNQSKSSFGNAGDSDVEKEVLELNTIVEERRAESNRVRSNDDHHIPAVAPSMQVGARSETLNDIGSALSRPLTIHHINPGDAVQEIDSKELRPRSSRVSGWLSSVTTPAKPSAGSNEPFYKCDADTTNERTLSVNSSGTALDSVLYTLESSPTTSKRYSRSLMITPLTPVDDGNGDNGERQVGIAL